MTDPQKTKYEDSLNQVIIATGDEDNEIKRLKAGYHFRIGSSLKSCLVEHVKFREGDKYYFISIGHSRGVGFYNIPSPNQRGFDILWNFELSEALGHLNFEYAIFNNCNVTLFDNLVLLSKNTKFLIGTENYLAFEMFNMEALLCNLKIRILAGYSDVELGQALYDGNLFYILQYINLTTKGVTNPSLYYFNLLDIKGNKLGKDFNRISAILLSYFKNKPTVIKKIRNKLVTVGSAMETIDMIVFFKELIYVISNKKIKVKLISFMEKYNKSLLSSFQRAHYDLSLALDDEKQKILDLSGTSLLFPTMDYVPDTDKYYENYRKNKKQIPIKGWYLFLDSIL